MSKWYDSREARDKTSSYSAVTTQVMAKNEDELHKMFMEFEKKMKDHEDRFGAISDEAKIVALKTMIPENIMANRFRGHKTTTYMTMRNELVDYMTDRPNQGAAPMDISTFVGAPPGIEESWMMSDEMMNAFYMKGKGKGGAGGGKGGRECYHCGEKGHFARECTKNPWATTKGGGQKGQYGFGGKGPTQQQWNNNNHNHNHNNNNNNYNTSPYGKGWNQQQPWNKGVRPPFAKGGWKGKGPTDLHAMMESAPNMHDEEERKEEEGGGDGEGEEPMWAMWSLMEVDEEEPKEEVPPLTDSSDDDDRTTVNNAWKIKKTKKKKKTKTTTKNRFEALTLLEENVEEEQHIMMNEETKEVQGDWIKVTATVDSGSAAHALPSKSFEKVPATEGPKFGQKYLTANGDKIVNEGEKVLKMRTDAGMPIGVKWQMTKVVKPLLSVKKLNAGGSTVILEEKNPRIIDRNGYVTPLRSQGGVFVVDLWIKAEYGKLFSGR